MRILSLVGRHRFIQSHHLAAILPGSRQHLIRRLGRLFHANLVDRPVAQIWIKRTIGATFAYCLTPKGLRTLAEKSLPFPKTIPRNKATSLALSLAHSLRVTDILIATEASALRSQALFVPPDRWPAVEKANQENIKWQVHLPDSPPASTTVVIPDGAFALKGKEGQLQYFILELDRGTMPVTRGSLFQSSFRRKVIGYKETRRRGILWSKFEVPAFRVLVVAETKYRLTSLQHATAACFRNGESEMFLFTVASDILAGQDILRHAWETCSGKQIRLFSD